MLFLNNDDVKQVLTMEITMNALDQAYRELARQEAVCRPRIDIQIPTQDAKKIYQWGTMEGGSTSGYFAIRMKSDVIYEQEYRGAITQEKYCVQPGRFCGLILLNSIQNGEPLALINDGYLQHMRVGADSGIGAKYMARDDAEVVGMIGSGGMARSHVESFLLARPKLKKIQVYSPTKENREAYAKEISENYGLEVRARCQSSRCLQRRAYRGGLYRLFCADRVRQMVGRGRARDLCRRQAGRRDVESYRCVACGSATRLIHGDCRSLAWPMNTSPMPPSRTRMPTFR